MSEAQPSRRQARVLKAWTRFHRWAYRRTVQYLADSGPAHAEILAAGERKAMWERIHVEAPWYAGYQQRTSREIPHIRLPPAQSPH